MIPSDVHIVEEKSDETCNDFRKIEFSNCDLCCIGLCDPGGCGAEFRTRLSVRVIFGVGRRCVSKALRVMP